MNVLEEKLKANVGAIATSTYNVKHEQFSTLSKQANNFLWSSINNTKKILSFKLVGHFGRRFIFAISIGAVFSSNISLPEDFGVVSFIHISFQHSQASLIACYYFTADIAAFEQHS
ncbi:hypothetical protein T4B_571 [Trichinella pseudospiralis]|uniref:Uncharacterized protein n=1 Tax=Trichinella pseudospiralis TaxID=6337 RepID=A0A0V1E192_TRIPS|nr:hypothetical protein T4A_5882 [Trichinella pseudospiralis]KRZ22459.1 hypothetical protein T4B_571 [Trichinella pseudospiralis]